MSEPENFLSRWSRRKLEGEPEKAAPQSSEQDPSARPRASGDPKPQGKDATASAALDSRLRGNERGEGPDKDKETAFDISSLPSLESITSETDIRLFLQKGVPADLTRAALRRAWTADPAIRDFIEIAENQYDFATGSDLPGFGALDASADDIRQMVANVFGDGPKTLIEQEATTSPEGETPAKPETSEVAGSSAESPAAKDDAAAPQDQQSLEAASADPIKDVVHRNKVTIAMQQSNIEVEYDPAPARRPHGRALPQ